MSVNEIMRQTEQASPRPRPKFVGAYYLLTALTCAVILFFRGDGLAFMVRVLVIIVYLITTAFLYGLSKPGRNR
jgi:VIT1/CCC1 family predicted Fe2+/Mn2+ transporter